MPIRITEVRDRQALEQFIGLPWTIYPGRYPLWVPPLRTERRAFLDPRRNPFFDFADVRLLPLGWLRLLWHRPRIDALRIITLGVLKPHRHLGIDACLCAETYRQAIAKGIRRGEASWILETNAPMRRALEKMGFAVSKTYRLYDRPL